MSGPAAGGVEIVPVEGRRDLDRFIRLKNDLHRDDPAWVAPLMLERRAALDPKHNPLFQHAEARFWIARRNGRDVGRISAQVDRLALETHRNRTGFFGMLAAEDDPAVIRALLATAEAWLTERGMDRVQGPFSLSINEETGLLVDGFDEPPSLLMGHDRRYLGPRLKEAGYAKARDVYAYDYDITVDMPPAVRSMLNRPLPAGVTVRHLDMARYDRDIRAVTSIFNNAWAGNWGFVPLTEAETAHLAKELRPLVNEKLIWFVEKDGEPVAFSVCLPNLNEAIHDLDGRLLPLGWAKLLWRLKVRGVKTVRVPLMGVKREFAKGLRAILPAFLVIDNMRREALKLGYRRVELSWVLEDNQGMRHIAESLHAKPYKTYRVYEKALSTP